jgi:hypothetical protein
MKRLWSGFSNGLGFGFRCSAAVSFWGVGFLAREGQYRSWYCMDRQSILSLLNAEWWRIKHIRTGSPDFVRIVVTSEWANMRLWEAFAELYFASTSWESGFSSLRDIL